MATSHPTYPHQAPGPSNYYQPSPSPHPYGAHSPGPTANPYQYSYPAHPPPLNSHHGLHQQSSAPRMNTRAPPFTPMAARGPHPYPNYHTHPHAHAHSPYAPPIVLQAPHPQHPPQHNLYAPQASKFPQTYSPSYPFPPSATTPTYSPSWTAQPPSPLPKQLAMPPPRGVASPAYYEPPPAPPPAVAPQHTPQDDIHQPPPAHDTKPQTPPAPTPPPEKPLSPPSPPPQLTSHPVQIGTISTDAQPSASASGPESMPSSPTSTSADTIKATNPVATWAIWSRRPRDPSLAPGIIISPRARPPVDVVQNALELRTPPPSPPVSPPAQIVSLPAQETTAPTEDGESQKVPSSARSSESPAPEEAPLTASTVSSTVPSSSVTEITETPTIPGSPASTNTSVSLVKEFAPEKVEEATLSATPSATVAPVTEPTETKASIAGPDTTPTPSAALPIPESTSTPAVPDSTPAATSTPTSATTTSSSTPTATAPVTPAAPPVKKSWADLLRQGSSASSSGLVKNALPTSSVVGISIPAVANAAGASSTSASGAGANSAPGSALPSAKKTELLSLLTTGPPAPPTSAAAVVASSSGAAAAGASATQGHIKPRGLVNSGNMCFANSVLQVLVYCPPFNRLFGEMGKVLGGIPGSAGGAGGAGGSQAAGSSSGSGSGSGSGGSGVQAYGSVVGTKTPLIDATIEFLKEFVEEKKRKQGRKGQQGGYGYAKGSGGGKGKEREIVQDEEDEDDWDGESFLPSYVYDAMKEKKRFDNMRGGQQEDAEEFFGFYLDTLEEELLSILHSIQPPPPKAKAPSVEEKEEAEPPQEEGWMEVGKKNRTVVTRTIKATESPITRIFGGKFRSTLKVPQQKDSVIVEDWRSLRLDIQRDQIHTIQDALSYISHPQPVQVTNPARPGVTIDASQQVLIEALPPILVLHMKRFCYDTTVGGVVKVGKQVRFGPELEIGVDVMPRAKRPSKYKLFGALYHHGLSASGGHYTLDVLHPNRYPSSNPAVKPREGWVRIDDELVSDVRPDDVFGAFEKDDSRCAYLLFYRRVQ
ncbi:hypothetical protein AX16_006047 [Volvariella volvacea WC 439]|nr:hypothetical protein AX16_006047 [Volvariella volvacea WC 439]